MSSILVTGGAGYIGSHVALRLLQANRDVVVIDNLYSGHRWAVPDQAVFYQGDAGDTGLVADILRQHDVDSVIHLAGHVVVPESIRDPAKYYHNNVFGSFELIKCCMTGGVSNFVFSSSAAVYGIPGETKTPIAEETDLKPISPYGTSKLMTEWMLRDMASAADPAFNYVSLRYFNVAGAHSSGQLGQATPDATHLVKVACEAACGLRNRMSIFGTDYDTPDGTCIRDYIHVEDLADAHLSALGYLEQGGSSTEVNCGYGKGFSVREVIGCLKQVSGVDFEVTMQPRRIGDPPQLISNNQKIRALFDWQPRLNDLAIICRTAYEWERTLSRSGSKARAVG